MKKKLCVRKNISIPMTLHSEIMKYEDENNVKLNISKICQKAIKKHLKTNPIQVTTA